MVQVHVQTKQTYKERKKKKKDGRNGAASAWREKWAKGREREREIMQHKVEGSSCMWHKYRILRECLDSSEDDGKVDPTKRT